MTFHPPHVLVSTSHNVLPCYAPLLKNGINLDRKMGVIVVVLQFS